MTGMSSLFLSLSLTCTYIHTHTQTHTHTHTQLWVFHRPTAHPHLKIFYIFSTNEQIDNFESSTNPHTRTLWIFHRSITHFNTHTSTHTHTHIHTHTHTRTHTPDSFTGSVFALKELTWQDNSFTLVLTYNSMSMCASWQCMRTQTEMRSRQKKSEGKQKKDKSKQKTEATTMTTPVSY